MINEIIKLLTELQEKENVDEIKIYFIKSNDYCVKLIKDKKIVKCQRAGKERKKHLWK